MKRLVPALILLLATTVGPGLGTSFQDLPPAGIEDEYLVRNGRRHAIGLLGLMLENDANAEFYPGIVRRMDALMVRIPNADAVSALERFVLRNSSGAVTNRALERVSCQALRTIGARGNEFGVESLERMLQIGLGLSPEEIRRAKAQPTYRNVGCALVGLGLSGRISAQVALRKLHGTPPPIVDLNRNNADFDFAFELWGRANSEGLASVYGMAIPSLYLKIPE